MSATRRLACAVGLDGGMWAGDSRCDFTDFVACASFWLELNADSVFVMNLRNPAGAWKLLLRAEVGEPSVERGD